MNDSARLMREMRGGVEKKDEDSERERERERKERKKERKRERRASNAEK